MDFINVMDFWKNGKIRFKVRNRKNSVNINLWKFAAAISASITVAGYGMIISWTSPSLPYLTSSSSKFAVTEMQGAWIASLLSCGIIAGYILNPFLIDTIGSKKTLLFLAVPQILSCILVYFGRNWIVLCSARIIGGIGYGGGLCSTAVYVSQIGDENNRGFFLTFVKMFFNIGVFITMIFGAFLSYDTMNLAILGIPVVFVISFFFMPDTDQFSEKGEYVQEKLTDNDNDCEDKQRVKENRDDRENSSGIVEDSDATVENSINIVEISSDVVANANGLNANTAGLNANTTGLNENTTGLNANTTGLVRNAIGLNEKASDSKETTNINSETSIGNFEIKIDFVGHDPKNLRHKLDLVKNTNVPIRRTMTPDESTINSMSLDAITNDKTDGTKNPDGTKENKTQRSNWWKLFFLKNNRRAMLIILSASLTEILSGHMAIVSFAQQIFEYSNASLKAEYAALILSSLKIGASFFSTLLVEKFGRRHIFLTTGILASLSQGSVGLFFFLKLYLKIDVSSLTWLPLVGVSMYEVVGSIGMSSLYYVYQGELFSDDIKGQGVTCTNIFYEIMTFLVKLNFQMVIDAVGIYSVFWGFSVCCAIGSCITYWIAPETKGKSKREIQKLLGDTIQTSK